MSVTLPLRPSPNGARSLETMVSNALSLRSQGRIREAITVLQECVNVAPLNPVVLYWCGVSLIDMRDYAGACQYIEQAVKHDPGAGDAWHNLGVAYEASGQWKKARHAFQQAITHQTNNVLSRCNLGGSYYRLGDPEKGFQVHSEALAIPKASTEEQAGRALVRLLREDWELGWREYEKRWSLPAHRFANPRPDGGKLWTGKPLNGQRVLVHHEQGIGDTLQFLRYLPYVEAKGGRAILKVQPELVRLLDGYPHCEAVIGSQDRLPTNCPYYVSLMSLPFVMSRRESIHTPIVRSKYVHRRSTGPDLSSLSGLRVGYCPRGSKHHMNDADRSMPFGRGYGAPLSAIEGIALVGFHERFVAWHGHSYEMADFADTAAIVDQLDLLITVDTSLTHLALAMGKPVWLLPPASPEFRWGLGESSPWYPGVRLYRRKHVAAWPEVMERVVSDLEREAR